MSQIQLIDRNRQPIGTITCKASGTIVTIENHSLSMEIQKLVDGAHENGLELRSGGQVEVNGKLVFSERNEHVFPTDERFPSALIETINRTRFSGQRVFGILVGRKS